MHRRIRRAYTALVEQGCTKISTVGFLSHLDLLIAKATSPDDIPLPEHLVWEFTFLFSSSPSSSRSFAIGFTRRFGQTKCWRVALKCLLLLHRLLRTLPSHHPFRADLLSARTNALISFHPCHFRDASSSFSSDYTIFIGSYARLLDEALNFHHFVVDMHAPPPSPSTTFQEKMQEAGQALELAQQLPSLVDRAMECVPAGAAARSFLVRSAMKQIARDSFACYHTARQNLSVVLDNILEMPYHNCVEGLRIYRKAAEQAVQLSEFYQCCRRMKICGPYEYPLVEKIPRIQVQMLESFVEQMWQMTESSSTSSPSTTSEVEGNMDTETSTKVVITDKWERFDEDSEEIEKELALIQFREDGETSWEVLLEASVYPPWIPQSFNEPWKCWIEEDGDGIRHEKGDGSLQVYHPYVVNPFFWS